MHHKEAVMLKSAHADRPSLMLLVAAVVVGVGLPALALLLR
jgi:hypothetical protein